MMLVVSTTLVYESIRRFFKKFFFAGRVYGRRGHTLFNRCGEARRIRVHFADCTIIRRSMEQSGVVITVQICIGKVHGSSFGHHTRCPLLFASLTVENSGRLCRL